MSLIRDIINDQVLATIIVFAFVLAVIDVIAGIVAAIKSGNFSWGRVADFIPNHVLVAVLPIVAVSVLASACSAVLHNVPDAPQPIPMLPAVLWLAAWGMVIAYLIDTLNSLGVHVNTLRTGTPAPPNQ